MKHWMIALAPVALLNTVAWGQTVSPILVKQTASGFVMAHHAQSTTCEIFPDRVQIRRSFGGQQGIRTLEVRRLQVTGQLPSLVAQAAAIVPTEQPGPVDGPSEFYTAYQIQGNRRVAIQLLERNGGSGRIVERQGPAAQLLRRVMDETCGG